MMGALASVDAVRVTAVSLFLVVSAVALTAVVRNNIEFFRGGFGWMKNWRNAPRPTRSQAILLAILFIGIVAMGVVFAIRNP